MCQAEVNSSIDKTIRIQSYFSVIPLKTLAISSEERLPSAFHLRVVFL